MDKKVKFFVSDCIDYDNKEAGLLAYEKKINDFIGTVWLEEIKPYTYEHAECGFHFHISTTIVYKEILKEIKGDGNGVK